MARKIKKRGFIMTGGGAKGLYEAGVIHALHLTGMEFDVITGSSIGAMNSIFFAEYLFRKRSLPEEVRSDPEKTLEAMNDLVKAFHHAWLMMPEKRIIDDSEAGPIGRLKDDLVQFHLSLPQLTQLIWWWRDPNRNAIPPVGVWGAATRMVKELLERLGGWNEVLNLVKFHGDAPVQAAIRAYLRRFGMERSLIPSGDDQRLKEIFTNPITPLRLDHLLGSGISSEDGDVDKQRIVLPERSLREYWQAGIDVRVTRANYRTGRLEISSYMSPKEFARYLDRQGWRLETAGPEVLPVGSFRLQVPGNPNAVNAALASGRFPGVFSPYPIDQIYLLDETENQLLKHMLSSGLDDNQVEQILKEAFDVLLQEGAVKTKDWGEWYAGWSRSPVMREFFPRLSDFYIDGGAIDNTPSNSAVDAIREWAEREGISKRDVELDLFVVLLHAEPKVAPDEAKDPSLYEVVQRTLNIQSAAKLSSDAVVVENINRFGARGEELARLLKAVLRGLGPFLETLDESQQEALRGQIADILASDAMLGEPVKPGDDILGWVEQRTNTLLSRLPLQVTEIKILPDRMPLSTLQFTERLGYRQENAIDMLTMGCYQTLWALRLHLEPQFDNLDEQDRQVLELARRWMGFVDFPKDADGREALRNSWQCQRTSCVFYTHHCLHGECKPL